MPKGAFSSGSNHRGFGSELSLPVSLVGKGVSEHGCLCLLISKWVSKRKEYESLSVFKPVPSRSDSYCSMSLENTRSWAISKEWAI